MKPDIRVIFIKHQVIDNAFSNALKRVTVRVYVDMAGINGLAIRANSNKSRKARSGPISCEVLAVEPVESGQLVACR